MMVSFSQTNHAKRQKVEVASFLSPGSETDMVSLLSYSIGQSCQRAHPDSKVDNTDQTSHGMRVKELVAIFQKNSFIEIEFIHNKLYIFKVYNYINMMYTDMKLSLTIKMVDISVAPKCYLLPIYNPSPL